MIFLLLPTDTNASFKAYEAELSESQWDFQGNPLGCRLSHSVPSYGQAVFAKTAGQKRRLNFSMGYKRHSITSTKVAAVYSQSPSWLPRIRPRNLGEIAIHQGNTIFKAQETASWRLLNELEIGNFPTFRYQEFDTLEDQVSVSLSAVGFKKNYDKFLNCLTTLVEHDLSELTQMTLHFDFDKYSVREHYKNKLKSLAAYVKYDENVEIIFVNGYTDAKGSKSYNRKLSSKRIESVKKLLMTQGATDNKFKTTAFGEANPIASNRRASGRAKNRRVYVRVAQQ